MKKSICYLFSVMIVYYSCNGNGQTEKNSKDKTTVSIHKEEKGNPKVDINVNKRYDQKGNLIAFDSTYSSYYSNRIGGKKLMDSLFREFKPMISQEFPLTKDKRFSELFFNDSLLYSDFFHEDFFRKRLELNDEYMENMMFQMDSIKNEFFREHSMRAKK